MDSAWEWAVVNPKDATPLHAQLERSIRVAMASRRLKPGDQLPTVRQLAVALRINANTVAKVYSHLERAGALETRRGVGTFIADRHDSERNQAARTTEPYTAAPLSFMAEITVATLDGSDNKIELLCDDLLQQGHVQAFNAQIFAIHYR